MALTPEGRVKTAIKRALTKARVWFFCPVSNGMGRHGIPDFICCVPTVVTPDMVGTTVGRFVAIEAKAKGMLRNVSAMQASQIADIRSAAGVAEVVDGVDLLPAFLLTPEGS